MTAVNHYCPGGREQGGGIGRMVGNIVDAAALSGDRHRVHDTRGSSFDPLHSAKALMMVIGSLVACRLRDPRQVHHFHVAGRGSTLRKLILTSVCGVLGLPYVLHLHDYDYRADYLARSRWQQRLVKRMFQRAQKVIVLGQRDREIAVDLLDLPQDRVSVLHNAVPDPGPRPDTADRPTTILFLGRLSERKGVPELLTALASPAMLQRRWRAILAGDGPLEEYGRQARDLGIAGRVTMPGWLDVSAVSTLCHDADILVLPSHAEGLAMAVLEGLSHGLAVVTTRVGAHSEVLTDNVSGVFVPVGDAQALTAALVHLIDDPTERARIATGGHAVYEQGFSMNAYMTQLESTYASLTRGPQ